MVNEVFLRRTKDKSDVPCASQTAENQDFERVQPLEELKGQFEKGRGTGSVHLKDLRSANRAESRVLQAT